MASLTFWQKLWRIAKPVVTLGLSLFIGQVTKTTDPLSTAVKKAGTDLSDTVIEEVDSLINQSTDTSKVRL